MGSNSVQGGPQLFKSLLCEGLLFAKYQPSLIAIIMVVVLVDSFYYCTSMVKWVVLVKIKARRSTVVIYRPIDFIPLAIFVSRWVTTNVYTMNLNGFCPTIIPKMIILLPYKTRIKRFGCIYEQSLQTFVPNDNDDPLCWHTPICTGQNLHTYIPKVYNIQHVQQTRVSNNTWLCLYIDIMHNPPGRVSKLLLILYKYGQMGSARQNPYTDLHNCLVFPLPDVPLQYIFLCFEYPNG